MMRLTTVNDAVTRLRLMIMTLEELTTLDKLNEAFAQCSRISQWKESTQRYKTTLLMNNTQLQEDIRNGTYRTGPTNGFELSERGKLRHIEAPAIRDRVIQKVLCKYILVPELSKPLIYDNYASLKNRGTSFARKRIAILLRKFIQEHGEDGYILQIDIRRYFDSIDHDVLKELVHKRIHETPEIMSLIDHIIDSSMDRGLNLGSEAPQIFAIYYLSPVDTYAKTVRKIKYYGRYMDDIFILSESKEELRDILAGIKKQLSALKLEINERKTHITKLRRGFT
ncbi:MAG: RNA-directed DNA polymerase, partial [Clostridiales bacterium]|nr:RNA-directed DNA polymerase [Clostridiales bacterium]